MGAPFDSVHAGWQSQLAGGPVEVCDSEEVTALRGAADYDGLMALGGALSRQLRYREAAAVYSAALALCPDRLEPLRLRAGRLLSLLEWESAQSDLLRCLTLGGDPTDLTYRLGLSCYYGGAYDQAMVWLARCFAICDDEMGIGVIYWHTLSAWRANAAPHLLERYHPGMAVGHHTAYEKAVRVWTEHETCHGLLSALEDEPDDMEYVIALYGICRYLFHSGRAREASPLLTRLLTRDAFWPCFSYLAAWNDTREPLV